MTDVSGPDEITRIESELHGYVEHGVIQYYLPSDPAGERYVVGVEGKTLNMDPQQGMAFLMGAGAVARRLARQHGMVV